MEITRHIVGDVLELRVKGKLDAYWADHFTETVMAVVREGHHAIVIDMAGVDYMSSAGMGPLVRCRKQLAAINGSFELRDLSPFAAEVLQKTGLDQVLCPTPGAGAAKTDEPGGPKGIQFAGGTMEVHGLAAGGALTCTRIGRPEIVSREAVTEAECRPLSFASNVFGIGVGAPGKSFAECRGMLGEFVGAAGAVAYLPTNQEDVPDYLLAAEHFVPELQTVHALACGGEFSHLLRFTCRPGARLTLEGLAGQALSVVQADLAGIVAVVEVGGLVGAALRRSPALVAAGEDPLAFPTIREWLSFTAEPAFGCCLAVVAGVAAAGERDDLKGWLLPLGHAGRTLGHFHAMAFAYQPLRDGRIDLGETIRALFEVEGPRGILHLLNDDRHDVGVGQSAFVGGACWAGPITRLSGARD